MPFWSKPIWGYSQTISKLTFFFCSNTMYTFEICFEALICQLVFIICRWYSPYVLLFHLFLSDAYYIFWHFYRHSDNSITFSLLVTFISLWIHRGIRFLVFEVSCRSPSTYTTFLVHRRPHNFNSISIWNFLNLRLILLRHSRFLFLNFDLLSLLLLFPFEFSFISFGIL